MIYDVIITGGGVVGGAVARGLSRYQLSVLCLEKEADVCCGTSKANTGIIHSPALIPAGTRKAEYAARGNLRFRELSSKLGFAFQKTGALVIGSSEQDEQTMKGEIRQGVSNWKAIGMDPPEYRIISGNELKSMEPELNPEVRSALYCPDAGRIIPYEYGIALWENAVANNVRLELNTEVTDLSHTEEQGRPVWILSTSSGEFKARYVVNCAGHGSNAIGAAAGFLSGGITGVKGQYIILNRNVPTELNYIIFQVPDEKNKSKGKGILVTKTVYGNIMIGPDARRQDSDNDTSTDIEALLEVIEGARKSVPGLDVKKAIKTFAGIRPKPAGGDFIIESGRNFVHLCGIESPGLTSSPAIASDVVAMLEKMGLGLIPDSNFNGTRKPVVDKVLELDAGEVRERINLPESDPGRLVCRCEQVPQYRILDALARGIPVTTIDGVKRRTRAGQGQCQGAFCGNRVRKIIADALELPEEEVTQRGSEPELRRITVKDLLKYVP